MKKRGVKLCILISVSLLAVILIAMGIFIFSFDYKRNKRPDDDVSQAIYEAVGREKVYYYGKEYSESGEVAVYQYTVYDYEDENLLTDMVAAANAAIQEKGNTEKIHLVIQEEFVSGAYSILVQLNNDYEYEGGYKQYKSLQSLKIYGSFQMQCGCLYDKASTYINLPDIKSLVVSKEIAKNAEEEGIDWYEVWPDLEHYEVLED